MSQPWKDNVQTYLHEATCLIGDATCGTKREAAIKLLDAWIHIAWAYEAVTGTLPKLPEKVSGGQR